MVGRGREVEPPAVVGDQSGSIGQEAAHRLGVGGGAAVPVPVVEGHQPQERSLVVAGERLLGGRGLEVDSPRDGIVVPDLPLFSYV